MARFQVLPSRTSRHTPWVLMLVFGLSACAHRRAGSWDQDHADGIPTRVRARTYAGEAAASDGAPRQTRPPTYRGDVPNEGAGRPATPRTRSPWAREQAESRGPAPLEPFGRDQPADGQGSAPRLSWPLARVFVTSPFGPRLDPLNPDLDRSRWHAGVDLRGRQGTAVLAAGAGRVVRAGWRGNHGHSVCIDHGHGLRTTYSHLARIFVEAGDDLDAGSPVGLLGDSGRTTGPHLHFEVRRWGRPIDPVRLLGPRSPDDDRDEDDGDEGWGFGGSGL